MSRGGKRKRPQSTQGTADRQTAARPGPDPIRPGAAQPDSKPDTSVEARLRILEAKSDLSSKKIAALTKFVHARAQQSASSAAAQQPSAPQKTRSKKRARRKKAPPPPQQQQQQQQQQRFFLVNRDREALSEFMARLMEGQYVTRNQFASFHPSIRQSMGGIIADADFSVEEFMLMMTMWAEARLSIERRVAEGWPDGPAIGGRKLQLSRGPSARAVLKYMGQIAILTHRREWDVARAYDAQRRFKMMWESSMMPSETEPTQEETDAMWAEEDSSALLSVTTQPPKPPIENEESSEYEDYEEEEEDEDYEEEEDYEEDWDEEDEEDEE
jgi:hypothetical protein